MKTLKLDGLSIGNQKPLVAIGGLCCLESPELLFKVGKTLKDAAHKAGLGFVLKCSYDKANRSSLKSYRGMGVAEGLAVLKDVKRQLKVPLLTDVHETSQVEAAADAADILQIPAFLCRQTDLLLECGRSGKVVNIKKGQFMAPWDVKNAIEKVESTGNTKIVVTERGTSFGYNNLVVDMRGLEIMKLYGYPVVFDCTHSVQLPGALGHATGGQREFAPVLARSAVAVGLAGVFFETHPNPNKALSDGPNSLALADVPKMLSQLKALDKVVKS